MLRSEKIDAKNPLVSVIIPTYNRAHLLSRAIGSVLKQSYQDFELILVDDGSTDDTEKVVKGFHDERVRYISYEENRGGAAARNVGIQVAEGEYLAFLDSDDEWYLDKLERQLKVFEGLSSKFGVVYTGGYLIFPDDTKVYIPSDDLKPTSGDIHKDILERSFVNTVSALVRRECFDGAGLFDERLPSVQDRELWMRVSKRYYFHYLKKPLYYAYAVPNRISSDDEALLAALRIILGKHRHDLSQYPSSLAKHLHRIGNLLCQSGRMLEGRKYLAEAIVTDPSGFKSLVAWMASFFGPNGYNKIVSLKRRIVDERVIKPSRQRGLLL